jgi:hypothetical protein
VKVRGRTQVPLAVMPKALLCQDVPRQPCSRPQDISCRSPYRLPLLSFEHCSLPERMACKKDTLAIDRPEPIATLELWPLANLPSQPDNVADHLAQHVRTASLLEPFSYILTSTTFAITRHGLGDCARWWCPSMGTGICRTIRRYLVQRADLR